MVSCIVGYIVIKSTNQTTIKRKRDTIMAQRKNMPGYTQQRDAAGRMQWMKDGSSSPSPSMMKKKIVMTEQMKTLAESNKEHHRHKKQEENNASQKKHNTHQGQYSTVSQDMKENEIVEQFLDEQLYPHIFDSYVRKHDKESQYQGIDIVADGVCIDEKAQVKYKNRNLPTNAFEISHLSKRKYTKKGHYGHHESRGWFVDDSLETEYYLIVSLTDVDVDNDRDAVTDSSQIQGVNAYIVDKYDLLDTVEQQMSIEDMEDTAREMRRKGQRVYENGDVRLVCSHHLQEKPVTVVWKKENFPTGTRVIQWTQDDGIVSDETM